MNLSDLASMSSISAATKAHVVYQDDDEEAVVVAEELATEAAVSSAAQECLNISSSADLETKHTWKLSRSRLMQNFFPCLTMAEIAFLIVFDPRIIWYLICQVEVIFWQIFPAFFLKWLFFKPNNDIGREEKNLWVWLNVDGWGKQEGNKINRNEMVRKKGKN